MYVCINNKTCIGPLRNTCAFDITNSERFQPHFSHANKIIPQAGIYLNCIQYVDLLPCVRRECNMLKIFLIRSDSNAYATLCNSLYSYTYKCFFYNLESNHVRESKCC